MTEETPRRLPEPQDDERQMLRGWLDFHRATFARKLVGLTAAQLGTRSAEPSPMSLLGLLRHHAEGERYMMGTIFEGEPEVPYFEDAQDFGDFSTATDDLVAESLAAWHRACARSREIETAHNLDDLSAAPGIWGSGHVSLRWLLMHVIEEYARHNGHADLLRERVDGVTGW